MLSPRTKFGLSNVLFTPVRLYTSLFKKVKNKQKITNFLTTKDDILVMASEQGALEFPAEDIVLKGRLQPGKMFLADLENGSEYVMNGSHSKNTIAVLISEF